MENELDLKIWVKFRCEKLEGSKHKKIYRLVWSEQRQCCVHREGGSKCGRYTESVLSVLQI